MRKPIDIRCPHCQHSWAIAYEALQTMKMVYKDLEPRPEEYAIACPRCGETSVQIFSVKGGQTSHE
jgi:hypothetical protein